MDATTKNPTVLVVEDDPALAALYDEKFQKEGFKTLIARDGAAGLNMAITKNPDFILLDVMLPKMNGLEMLEKLIASPIGHGIPVIVLSNLTEKEEKERAIKLGAKDYLSKAMQSPEEIVNKVKKYLGI